VHYTVILNCVSCEESNKSTQVFHSNRSKEFKDGSHMEVIIPYSPLRQNRVYDWPPEPTLSQVVNEKYRRKHLRNKSLGSKPPGAINEEQNSVLRRRTYLNTAKPLTSSMKSPNPTVVKKRSVLRRKSY